MCKGLQCNSQSAVSQMWGLEDSTHCNMHIGGLKNGNVDMHERKRHNDPIHEINATEVIYGKFWIDATFAFPTYVWFIHESYIVWCKKYMHISIEIQKLNLFTIQTAAQVGFMRRRQLSNSICAHCTPNVHTDTPHDMHTHHTSAILHMCTLHTDMLLHESISLHMHTPTH